MANTLLVLGNGFDKRCGLKSSFNEYVDSGYYSDRKEACLQAIEYIKKYGPVNHRVPANVNQLYEVFKNITFWDFYFAGRYFIDPNNSEEINEWFDFEARLKDFVQGAISDIDNTDTVFTKIIKTEWHIFSTSSLRNTDEIYYIILRLYIDYIMEPYKYNSNNRKSLASLLLNELKKYELLFGKYIEDQQIHDSDYEFKAKKIVASLIGSNHKLVCLNTFNYSDMSGIVGYSCGIWHINGDLMNPIFGIDLPMPEASYDGKPIQTSDLSSESVKEWYRFTKTYRRLELEGNSKYYPAKEIFRRVVVYGHSLNEQDYNYFFSLFNRMDLSAQRGKKNAYEVDFLYSEYGGKSREEAKRELIDRALPLLQRYNKEILHEPNFRIVDILYGNGAIKFLEAEPIAFT